MRAPRTSLTLFLLALLAAVGAAALAGCGGGATKDEHAPAACREGTAAILDALGAAPGEVALAGEAPLSDCLVVGAEEGELADLGEGALGAATKLNAQARADGGGKAAVELGFLIGAIARGSADTEGVHAELLRRLTVAARFAPEGKPSRRPSSPPTKRASPPAATTVERGPADRRRPPRNTLRAPPSRLRSPHVDTTEAEL